MIETQSRPTSYNGRTDVNRQDRPFARWDEDEAKNVAKRLACEYGLSGTEAVFVRVGDPTRIDEPLLTTPRQQESFGLSMPFAE